MRHPISRATAAAIFVLAAIGVAMRFHGAGTTPAFADFLEPILEAKTIRYKETAKWSSLPAELKILPAKDQKRYLDGGMTSVVMMLGSDRIRRESDWPAKTVFIWDGRLGKSISLLPDQKRATLSDDKERPKDRKPGEAHQDAAARFRAMLLGVKNEPGVKREPLGEKGDRRTPRRRSPYHVRRRRDGCVGRSQDGLARPH